ncbi:MAG: hypothetical protein ACRDZQ_05910 [Acidimicrobiales bacterium]
MRRKGILRENLSLHLVAVFAVACCLAATWWQLNRALSGNGLSWAYTFEWPFFAAYAVFMWWKLLHEDSDRARAAQAGPRRMGGPARPATPQDEEETAKLAAYNEYLASLAAGDAQRRLVQRRPSDP